MGTIAVIGAGASGMTAAISAARENRGHRILLFEQKEEAGKKLLVTGNGRCNLGNYQMDVSCYHTENPAFAKEALSRFHTEETLAFFDSIGLWTKCRGDYIYPRSGQAAAVRDLLFLELKRQGVHINLGQKVTKIIQKKDGFQITARASEKAHTVYADRVILSCGGKAGAVHGSDGSGYVLARSMGHTLVPVVPALVQLKASPNPLRRACGVRTEARVSAFVDGIWKAEDTGELQITDYGISGIPVFQISRHLSKALYEKKQALVKIDFLPQITGEIFQAKCKTWMEKNKNLTIYDCLRSIFPLKLGQVLLKEARIPVGSNEAELSRERLKKLADICKGLPLTICGTNGFDAAQVCAGGVSTTEIEPVTFESRLVKGLYMTGELLDVDGICGGYNLQWAWCSGYLAGKAAAKK